jgi:hypothetical protein
MLSIGRDSNGADVALNPSGVSMLVTGAHGSGKSTFTRRMLERFCTAGYQFCVLDGRGEYLDFQPAVVFGTQEVAPDPFEILTALEKPDVQAVVCLAAVLPARRAAFFERLNAELHSLREKTGRPHWLVIDEAQELTPRMDAQTARSGPPAENTIYVTTDPSAIDARIVDSVQVTVERAPGDGKVLVRFRNGKEPLLVTLPARTHPDRVMRKDGDVGKLLRRAMG